jgi:cytochrome c oxidase cbb3-type subunit 3
MSDFTSSFWSIYIAVISLVGILACLVLLWITARKKNTGHPDNTTGHVWDEDLREMNNPLPVWWVGLFVLTVIFGLGYLLLYPGLGSFKGSLDWSSQKEYDTEITQTNAQLASLYARFDAMPVEELAFNEQGHAIGEHLFMNNCAQCHASDGRGSKGFPNLTDADWLYGGSPENIKRTLVEGRVGQMPAMAAAVGSAQDIQNVAHYVLSLSHSPHDMQKAALGQTKFAVCAACHGADGKGNQTIGAPNLSDKVWLHGWGEAAIVSMIHNGKINQMPAQNDRLTPSQIHALTAYVWAFSHHSDAPAKP